MDAAAVFKKIAEKNMCLHCSPAWLIELRRTYKTLEGNIFETYVDPRKSDVLYAAHVQDV